MRLNGRELILSPRKTEDHYALIDAVKNNPELPELLYRAQMINDSLRATYINMTEGIDKLSFWNRYKKLKAAVEYQMFYTGKRGQISSVQYIIHYLEPQQIIQYFTEILELDGLDKKKVAEESPSAEISQKE